ncbi:hypothetical protein TIFTF001_030194 [Ficus carica]|uniref:Uncharacterized protein n=1 Tax=Ficus carica TaxID=3494 RepID=A0AA88DT70_FICCA|nr:hypothetical protein TIFTF001_030194 [Ficus carica]
MDDKRREPEKGRLGARGCQSSEGEGGDNRHLGAETSIVRREGRRQLALGCRDNNR